jgi:DNA-binding response OmpR family regulator
MTEAALILVIDDSAPVREMLAAVLRRAGHEVLLAAGGEEGMRLFSARPPDLVVLDLHMAGMDGWETLERLRAISERPVIMLTAADDERSRIRGLMRGADDYLVKPASAAELLARVVALLRRSRRSTTELTSAVYDDGLFRVDVMGRTTHVNGNELALTPLEFKLLCTFVRNPGVVLSKEQLLRDVWNDHSGGPGDHVKLYVGYLRKKLSTVTPDDPIETVRGFGYRWTRAVAGNEGIEWTGDVAAGESTEASA